MENEMTQCVLMYPVRKQVMASDWDRIAVNQWRDQIECLILVRASQSHQLHASCLCRCSSS